MFDFEGTPHIMMRGNLKVKTSDKSVLKAIAQTNAKIVMVAR